MTSFHFTTAEDYEDTRFGCYLLDIVEKIGLPLPQIKGFILKRFHKEGCWGIKATQPGRGEEPQIEIKIVSDSMIKGLDLVMQDLIGRLCGRHSAELKGHYSIFFGRRNEEGEPYLFEAGDRGKAKPLCLYFQDLEVLITELFEDRRTELLKNDELCALLKENEEKVKIQEEETKAQEERFAAQEKKYKSQEKRVQDKNKTIRDLKAELESNNVEFEADNDLIKRLRAEKRELQEKNLVLEKEVKELREVLDNEGIEIQEIEEEEDAMVE
jgi:hypothetical protein